MNNIVLKPNYKTSTINGVTNYLPIVARYEGTKKVSTTVLYGDPLATKKTALKYAQLTINNMYLGMHKSLK